MMPTILSLMALTTCVAVVYAGQDDDERVIRDMVDQAIARLNNGDATAFEDYWDEDADYVSVGGALITGWKSIQEFFEKSVKPAGAVQTARIERIRFLTPEIAVVDGSWTVTGVRDAAGKELPPIKGRGTEVVQKKGGRWRFVATREMVVRQ